MAFGFSTVYFQQKRSTLRNRRYHCIPVNFTSIYTIFQHLHATSSFTLLSGYYKTSNIVII